MNDRNLKQPSPALQPDGIVDALGSLLDKLDAFAATPTSARVEQTLQRAHRNGVMTAIAGVPGVGKTTTCRRYLEANYQNVWHCQFATYHNSSYSTLAALARALGFYTVPRTPSALGAELENALAGTRGLLICDEAQHLPMSGFEAIRGLYDAHCATSDPIGVAFVGHSELMAKMQRLPQLDGRITWPLRIVGSTAADVDAILSNCGVTDHKVKHFLRQHSTHRAGLRRIVAALRQAIVYAAQDNLPLREAHVRQAWRELAGSVVK